MASIAVFVAAQQGPVVLQKPTLQSWAPTTTLRHLGASITCPGTPLVRVEGSNKLGGVEVTFEGDMLDQTISWVVNTAGLLYLKCCFACSELLTPARAPAAAAAASASVLEQMMSDKRRHAVYHWPAHYPFSANKTAVRTIANGLMDAGRSSTATFGGFSSTESARDGRSQLWRLAEVLFDVVPHLAAMSARSIDMPKVFSDVADPVWVAARAAPPAAIDLLNIKMNSNIKSYFNAIGYKAILLASNPVYVYHAFKYYCTLIALTSTLLHTTRNIFPREDKT